MWLVTSDAEPWLPTPAEQDAAYEVWRQANVALQQTLTAPPLAAGVRADF